MREPLPEFPQFSSDFPLIFRRQKTITLQWCYVRVSQVSSVRPCESATAPARLNVSVLMNFHFQQTYNGAAITMSCRQIFGSPEWTSTKLVVLCNYCILFVCVSLSPWSSISGRHKNTHKSTCTHTREMSLSSRMRDCCGIRVKGHGFMNEQTGTAHPP